MKLYIVDWGSGYNFTYLLGDLGQLTLEEVGDQFRKNNPKIGIDLWAHRFVEFLFKCGLKEVEKKDIEFTRPQSHGVNYVSP